MGKDIRGGRKQEVLTPTAMVTKHLLDGAPISTDGPVHRTCVHQSVLTDSCTVRVRTYRY